MVKYNLNNIFINLYFDVYLKYQQVPEMSQISFLSSMLAIYRRRDLYIDKYDWKMYLAQYNLNIVHLLWL